MFKRGKKRGWYLDPNGLGHERYWDGKRWTAEVRNVKNPWSFIAPSVPPAAKEKNGKNKG